MGPALRSLVKGAKGVLVYPQILRGAFIVGASGGSGVFLASDDKAGVWGGPAFYTIGQGSFGLQAGGDASEVVLVALTERSVAAMLATSAKLGANASVAAGPVGPGAEPQRPTSVPTSSPTRAPRVCTRGSRWMARWWRPETP